jgi:hypothetical protein
MPHQLRRIITINLRNPKDGLPSGRIAEMDPRGGVLAVGINGVGKTTFLRLLPLFYGATPTQILKGTGRTALISHTLPDSSSAVCYEYERETKEDVRCVVMHARPGEEAPQFHIITGQYQESFFYNENNEYVTREEFKSRVEAMGVEVSRKLTLHQYRSVILNERLPTKEGVELRRLAAVHSLGPGALYNLDQISAAMANEKISFRDLKNIVVERVSDESTSANRTSSVKELKQNRESVVRWMEARAHLVEIMKHKPAASKLSEGIVKIKRLHMEMCSLNVAVKRAIAQLGTEVGELKERDETLSKGFQTQAQETKDHIDARQVELAEAQKQRDELRKHVKSADDQLRHFQAIDAESLEKLQSSESDLKAQLVQKSRELKDLEGAAGGATSNASTRQSQVQANTAVELEDLGERLRSELKVFDSRSQELRLAEDAALEQLIQPTRLKEIAEARILVATKMGELRPLIAKPASSPEALDAVAEAGASLDRANEDYRQAVEVARDAKRLLDDAHAKSDASILLVTQLTERCTLIGHQTESMQATLTPAPGSLLEFIRAGDPSSWVSTAKVIDPKLLTRDDLEPLYVDEEGASVNGRVRLGSSLLHVGDVPAPAWLDMAELRADLAKLQLDAQGAAVALSTAQTASRATSKAFREAEKHESACSAQASLSKTALGNAQDNKQRAVRFSQEEALRRQQEATRQQKTLERQRAALDAEELTIERAFKDSRTAVRVNFAKQVEALADEKLALESRFSKERAGIEERKRSTLLAIEQELKRELEGLGIDPERLSALNKSISTLDQSLADIAGNRHEVVAWRQFRREIAPSIEINRQELSRRAVRCDDIEARKSVLLEELNALEIRAKRELSILRDKVSSHETEIARLTSLLTRELRDYLDHVPAHLHIDWNTPELERAVSSRKDQLDTEANTLQRESRLVRNELIRFPGGPADWLDGKEKELPNPQILLSHQNLCEQAQVLCDWFDPTESGPYIDQLNKEMLAYFNLAGEFVRVLDQFERRVTSFNRELQLALSSTEHFERFRDLSVKVSSNVGQLGHLKLLREMQDRGTRSPLAFRSAVLSERDLPTDDDNALVRAFREVLQSDGAFRINLHDQVRLECSLYENGNLQIVSNEEEFRSVSSNGNSALITAVFLMGFVKMIRGESPVRLTWLVDEIGRFDGGNLSAFLHTLDKQKIDVISACPSLDPALARYFKRICLFEDNGAVFSSENHEREEVDHAAP